MGDILKKKNRNPELDALKGLAILLVIIGHAIQYNIIEFKTNPFFNMIYSFHMPLFIFISGYIAYFTVKVQKIKDAISVINSKFKTLVIPFLSWYFIVNYLLRESYLKFDFSTYSLRLIENPEYGLWFFWILFLCFILLIVILTIQLVGFKFKNMILESGFCYLIALIIMILPFEIAGFKLLKWYFPFFITGYLISKYKDILVKYLNIVIQSSIILFPILLTQYKRSLDLDFFKYWEGLNGAEILAIDTLYRYLIAFTGIAVCFALIQGIKKLKIFDKLVWLGRYTMEIYAIQFYFISIVGTQYITQNLGISVLVVGLATIITLLASLFISLFFIRKSKILSFLLLGR